MSRQQVSCPRDEEKFKMIWRVNLSLGSPLSHLRSQYQLQKCNKCVQLTFNRSLPREHQFVQIQILMNNLNCKINASQLFKFKRFIVLTHSLFVQPLMLKFRTFFFWAFLPPSRKTFIVSRLYILYSPPKLTSLRQNNKC